MNGEIIYCPYIPLTETPEQREKRMARLRAGKTYARVKASHPDEDKRGKRGEIKSVDYENGKVCVSIDMACARDGKCFTAVRPGRDVRDVWFREGELEDFERYDCKGDLVVIAQSLAELDIKTAVSGENA